jgi:hypothetical protein
MRTWMVLVPCAALALVAVATATAGKGKGGNSANAKACQKGWKDLVRQDGTGFKNVGDCVSYAAQGGSLKPKPTCTAGSEDFSAYGNGSQPTTFAGGTIDTSFGAGGGLQNGALFSGYGAGPLRLTFTNPVRSVSLDAASSQVFTDTSYNVTLTAYDASNGVVGTQTGDSFTGFASVSVTSASNNVKYVVVSSDSTVGAESVDNIIWGCG